MDGGGGWVGLTGRNLIILYLGRRSKMKKRRRRIVKRLAEGSTRK
jgi:hypothetical protein